ncbi:MAG TPA: tetratricopeptide repeat protein [Ktedonobacteraceae bacterium]|nr:tetratricopeptide repeat protein [Ktedonobacteraceae bacterium]
MPTTSSLQKIKVFYCYARKDQELREILESHLADLKRYYNLETWFDRQIMPGEHWEQTIEHHLTLADLILLLLSPDFLASDYGYNIELQKAFIRHTQGEVKIVPIVLRPILWRSNPFHTIQMLPTNAIPVTSWQRQDDALFDIVLGIEQVVQELIDLRKTSSYWHGKGKVLSQLQRYEEAIQAYDQAIALNPSSLSAYYSKGDIFLKLQRYEEAIQVYDQAITISPSSLSAYYSKGDTLLKLQRYEEAIRIYDQAIVISPSSSSYSNKGIILLKLQRYEEAIQAHDQAIALNPTSAIIHCSKGDILSKLQRYEEAIQSYDQAITLNPAFVLAYHSKSNALNSLKRYEEANKALQKAQELEN